MKLLLAAALALAPGLVMAQASRPAQQRTQEIVFPDDAVDGVRQGPALETIDTRPAATFSGLIQVRQDFKDKVRSEQLP